jgi:TonB family protein
MAVTLLVHLLALAILFGVTFPGAVVVPPQSIELLIAPEPAPKPERVKVEELKMRPPVGGKKVADTPPAPTKAAQIDSHGDVEVPVEKPKPVEIDKRSIFSSDDMGEASGNASGHSTDSHTRATGHRAPDAGSGGDAPAFSLNGRSIIGAMAQPANTSNREGRVMVEITVDQQGQVTRAQARVRGTTIQDAALWKAAEEAARNTRFNTDLSSPPLQAGVITYVFRLK